MNGLTYDKWLAEVNREVRSLIGLSVHDLADFMSYDSWNSGDTPRAGALMAIEGDDMAGMFLDDMIDEFGPTGEWEL